MSYCEVADIRAEGVTVDQLSDTQAEQLIKISCDYIDKLTRQWFEPREKTVKLNGRGGKILILPVFLIEEDTVWLDNEVIEDYVLYNRISPEDDRKYPKIYREKKWTEGVLNVQIHGKWGYFLSSSGDIRLYKT